MLSGALPLPSLYTVPAETYLQRGEVMVDQERQNSSRNNEELHPECVVVAIISSFELAVDHPHRGKGTSYVDHLSRG